MTTSAHLDAAPIPVLPGEEARITLELRNNGSVVEAYGFEVVGPAAGWTEVEPVTISLYPDTVGQVTLVARPPRDSSVPPGDLAFGVRVLPQERPEFATVPEGVLRVLPYAQVSAELAPKSASGGGGARFRVAVDNRGNQPVALSLAATDRSEALRFGLPPSAPVVEAGRAAFVPLPVRPRRRLWRGVPVPHAFQVTVTPAAAGEEPGAPAEPIVLDGTYTQQPLLGRGVLRAAMALLALAGVLAGVWFGLLRPVVRSAAKAAVKDHPTPVTAGQGPVAPANATLFSTRLTAADAAGGGPASTSYTIPAGKTMRLTDLVLENPQGDSGVVSIVVGGRTLLAPALENFREQDFHWASAILVPEKQSITLTVTCRTPGTPPGVSPAPSKCAAAALVSGTLE
jgi:hypothetical protein